MIDHTWRHWFEAEVIVAIVAVAIFASQCVACVAWTDDVVETRHEAVEEARRVERGRVESARAEAVSRTTDGAHAACSCGSTLVRLGGRGTAARRA